MKNLITIFAALVLAPVVSATECDYKEVIELKKVYVVPVYKADVTYVFNKKDPKSYAQIAWGIDEAATKECFTQGKEKFPVAKVVIPSVQVDSLRLKILGTETSTRLEVIPLANGHWSGFTTVAVPTSSKAQIIKARENGEQMISADKDISFRLSKIVRGSVGSLECTKKDEEAAILNLYKRMGELKLEVEKRNSDEKLDIEDILQTFIGTCVEFYNVDATSFSGLDSKQKVNSKIINGKIDLIGNLKVETTELMPSISIENITFLDI